MDNIIIKDESSFVENTSKSINHTYNGPIQKTVVTVHEVLPNGKKIFRERGHNKIILSGAEYHAHKDFNFGTGICFDEGQLNSEKLYPHHEKLPSYDTVLEGLDRTMCIPADATPIHPEYPELDRKIYLFAIGIDGCGLENSRKIAVRKDHWISPTGPMPTIDTPEGDDTIDSCLVPFRFIQTAFSDDGMPIDALDADEANIYFGCHKVTVENTDYAAYYFKTFDAAPQLHMRYSDGFSLNDVDVSAAKYGSIYALPAFRGNNVEAECVVELSLTVSSNDAKEWFNAIGKTSDTKVNTISLCSAVPYQKDGKTYFKDICPVTKYNMSNKSLSDANSGLQISYLLYY